MNHHTPRPPAEPAAAVRICRPTVPLDVSKLRLPLATGLLASVYAPGNAWPLAVPAAAIAGALFLGVVRSGYHRVWVGVAIALYVMGSDAIERERLVTKWAELPTEAGHTVALFDSGRTWGGSPVLCARVRGSGHMVNCFSPNVSRGDGTFDEAGYEVVWPRGSEVGLLTSRVTDRARSSACLETGAWLELVLHIDERVAKRVEYTLPADVTPGERGLASQGPPFSLPLRYGLVVERDGSRFCVPFSDVQSEGGGML